MIPGKPDEPLRPTAYRGALAMDAERYLLGYIGPSPHGVRRSEGWREGYLIHRCTDIKTGAWVEVTPGDRYMQAKLMARGPMKLEDRL